MIIAPRLTDLPAINNYAPSTLRKSVPGMYYSQNFKSHNVLITYEHMYILAVHKICNTI